MRDMSAAPTRHVPASYVLEMKGQGEAPSYAVTYVRDQQRNGAYFSSLLIVHIDLAFPYCIFFLSSRQVRTIGSYQPFFSVQQPFVFSHPRFPIHKIRHFSLKFQPKPPAGQLASGISHQTKRSFLKCRSKIRFFAEQRTSTPTTRREEVKRTYY